MFLKNILSSMKEDTILLPRYIEIVVSQSCYRRIDCINKYIILYRVIVISCVVIIV